MAFRTWGRLLLTALGVSVLAGAGQLGVAYGFGIVRLTGAFTGTTVNQWPAQLVWVGWFAANAAVAGAVLTGRLARRDTPPASTGRQLAIGGAAALGATAVAPLCMQPARAAELISVDPVWAVGICAILGAVIGAGAAIAVLFRPELGWNMAAVAGAVWLLALISVLPSLGTAGPLPTVRLGVLEPNWLDDAAAQRLALLLLPMVALLAGAATAGLARWRGQIPLVSAATGVAGPVLLAFAYLTAGPGDAVDRYQTTPYYGALIAILAGALGAAAAALLRWPVSARSADSQAIEPSDILRPLPAGPPLPGTEAAASTGDDHRDTEPTTDATRTGGQLATTGPGPRAADDTATVRTVPAHWDWPATTASGQHGPVPADAARPREASRPTGRRQHADTTGALPTTVAPTQDALLPSGQDDRAANPPAPASWLTDPTGEFTAGRQSAPSSRDGDTIGAANPPPVAQADDPTGSTTTTTAGGDKPGSDDTTSGPTAQVTPETVTDTPSTGSAGTPSASTPVAFGADTPSASTPSASTPSASTPSASTPSASTPSASTPSASSARSAGTSSTDSAGTSSTDSASTSSTDSAGTSSTGSAGDGTADAPAPKPRRTRKSKSTPVEPSTPGPQAPATGAGLPIPVGSEPNLADGGAHAPAEATADGAPTPGPTADRTAAAAGPTGGRTRRPARSGTANDVTGVDFAGPVDQDAALPGQGTEPGQKQTGGKDPQDQAIGRGGAASAEPAAEPEETVVPAADPAPVDAFGTGRAEPAATEGDGDASLFGEATADGPATDRWTPAAPAWPVTSAWTTAPATGTTEPEPAAPVVAEESDWTPRFRHRAPLPDLSRASTWDAFNTSRRAESDRTTSTPEQSASTPDQSGPTGQPISGADRGGPTDQVASMPDQGSPTAAKLGRGRWRDRASSTTDRDNGTTDQGVGTTDQGVGTTDQGVGTTDQGVGTTDRGVGRRGRVGEATGASAVVGSVLPASAGPGIPEQGGASGTTDRGASGAADSDGTDSAARRAAPASMDDAEQSSRRGRLGGLFRRNRARADEEKRPAADETEPLPTQDEEFVDWVAGLGKPIADNEPEQENGRRSLRSTGRHHRD
ncbi:hypothetical protein ACGFIE_29255 [Micromonospora sp. NPDC049275]|uniref:hypothetical protein n=1 Tax=Micromonospora sp. NPDC049275 TaxID=3364268 RepID=UPI0037168270